LHYSPCATDRSPSNLLPVYIQPADISPSNISDVNYRIECHFCQAGRFERLINHGATESTEKRASRLCVLNAFVVQDDRSA
jgi:hypothetical protein